MLKHDSYLILEYERSSTGELIFQKDYNKSITLQVYQYNNQDNHKIWLYLMKNSDYLKKARKYGHFTGYEN